MVYIPRDIIADNFFVCSKKIEQMMQILVAVAIIGAFWFLLRHIFNGGDKGDTVKETAKGAVHMIIKVLIPLALFAMIVMLSMYVFC